LRYPSRLRGLVLVRPAWLDSPLPPNLAIYPRLARLIRQHGAQRGRDLLLGSAEHAQVASESPDTANALAGQFTSPRAEDALARLEEIPNDAPGRDRSAWGSITAPTLVLASRQDPVHPFAFGEALAQAIPHAQFKELTPKSVSVERYAAEVQAGVAEFLECVMRDA
jgi:pimeloyl-ACP methyl ester carboxylesterase